MPHDSSLPPPILDVHTHVFNLHYLPIVGILETQGVPSLVARPLGRFLTRRARSSDLSKPCSHLLAAEKTDVLGLEDHQVREEIFRDVDFLPLSDRL